MSVTVSQNVHKRQALIGKPDTPGYIKDRGYPLSQNRVPQGVLVRSRPGAPKHHPRTTITGQKWPRKTLPPSCNRRPFSCGRVGVLERVGRVDVEEAAAIGADLFDGDQGRQGAVSAKRYLDYSRGWAVLHLVCDRTRARPANLSDPWLPYRVPHPNSWTEPGAAHVIPVRSAGSLRSGPSPAAVSS